MQKAKILIKVEFDNKKDAFLKNIFLVDSGKSARFCIGKKQKIQDFVPPKKVSKKSKKVCLFC